MAEQYRIAVVGSGPAGLSAAARAAHHDRQSGTDPPSHVLLESFAQHAKTIQRYQKGKHVMAEPGYLTLRSDVGFDAGRREEVLEVWQRDLDTHAVNVRYGAEVVTIGGERGGFELALAGGDTLTAEHVVLAVGLEGNPRKLGVPGDDLPCVQYQLDDPDAYTDEAIVVVGAGDSAIENALALARHNRVFIVNRRDEFSRAKDGNLNAVLRAISDPDVPFDCFYRANAREVRQEELDGRPYVLVLETPEGEVSVPCDRIIARLGAIPPRKFVESTGVAFPSERLDAVPELSAEYESNVAGLYVIGSLAGYPLIKQAMNQGYDVIEHIHGNRIKPADHPLLGYQFAGLPLTGDPDEALALFKRRIPMFRELNTLAFRELIIESNVVAAYPDGPVMEDALGRIEAVDREIAALTPAPRRTRLIREGEHLYRAGDYATSFFTIVEGQVELTPADSRQRAATLSRGEFFGENSLISGRPRLEDVRALANCMLVETPRRTMVKLMNSNDEVRSGIDWIFVVRELERHFAPGASFKDLRPISQGTPVREFKAGEVLFRAGDEGDNLHIIRRGSVTLTRESAGRELLVAELRSGQLVGEMALMGDRCRRETAVAAVAVETIEVGRDAFRTLVGLPGADVGTLQARVTERVTRNAEMEVRPESGDVMRFLIGEGLGEATDALVINESLCIGCDNCEKACAETHDGISRLDRKAGATFADVHVPVVCRHCEHPHCMKDCPPNAIHRAADGQVFIDDTCIGCGNCESNCPYDAIRMAYAAPKTGGLFSWLLFGAGNGPGEVKGRAPDAAALERGKRAYKCDACLDVASGPACVSACPTGAARRIAPEQFIRLVE